MTKLFIVVVDDADHRTAAYEKLKSSYDTAFLHRDAAIFVADDGAVSQDIATAAGISEKDGDFTGVVLRLGDGYSGYTGRALWEWLKTHDDD